jgi:threonine dehydrogenase-like Zn-dependent dehydrogenase
MSMKAVVFQGPFKLKVNEVPRPKIEHPDDVIVKTTTTAICGSDLHMYICMYVRTPLPPAYRDRLMVFVGREDVGGEGVDF